MKTFAKTVLGAGLGLFGMLGMTEAATPYGTGNFYGSGSGYGIAVDGCFEPTTRPYDDPYHSGRSSRDVHERYGWNENHRLPSPLDRYPDETRRPTRDHWPRENDRRNNDWRNDYVGHYETSYSDRHSYHDQCFGDSCDDCDPNRRPSTRPRSDDFHYDSPTARSNLFEPWRPATLSSRDRSRW